MNTPTPSNDELGTISKEDGHWSSHKRRERWIKTVPLKTSAELQTELTAVTEQRDRLVEALESIVDYQNRYPESIATEALQSLSQPKPESKDPHRFCRGGGGNNFHCGCKYDG